MSQTQYQDIKYPDIECSDLEACVRISSLQLWSVLILKHSVGMIQYPDILRPDMLILRHTDIETLGYRNMENTALIFGCLVIGVPL